MEPANSRADQPEALAEGRRIYLGNLLYSIKPSEIEQALADNGFRDFAQIHLSVDPVSGRNPGYCFVDFEDRDTAESALTSLSATIRGRLIKVGPCQPKQERRTGRWGQDRNRYESRNGAEQQAPFQRWGDWKRSDFAKGSERENGQDERATRQGPYAALDHFDSVFGRHESKRLYIGRLGRMIDQEQNYEEMRELLAGFKPTAIGKRITAHSSEWNKPGNHNYCFVDFATLEEAEKALKALDGMPYRGDRLRVSHAKGTPERTKQRAVDLQYAPRRTTSEVASSSRPYRRENGTTSERALEARSWRRRD